MNRDFRVNLLISLGHTLSHFYVLIFPALFLVWRKDFGISFAELGLAPVVMSVMSACLQTPLGFLVDRRGARPFLIGGTLLMSLAVSGMAFATSYWQVLALGALSGAGNAVFHPCDYSILLGSISKERIGRAFALHSFTGNVGFALAPPVTAALLLVMDWRSAILILGLLGLPVVAAVVWQSAILQDETRREVKKEERLTARQLMFERTFVMFFLFYMLGSMAGSGIQSWLITVLHQVKGIDLALASTALTAYLVGSGSGVLLGGWATDRAKSHRPLGYFIFGLTALSGVTTLLVGVTPMGAGAAIALMFCSGFCLGGSRTPRDILLKDASPPGEIGKIFGFISASLPLGAAITPVPFGFLIDHHHPEWVLILAACLTFLSIFCMGGARAAATRRAQPAPAE